MWKGIRNLEGSICQKGKKILYFKVERGWLTDMKVYITDKAIIPFDFWYGFNQETLMAFWENRLTPPTRQGLSESLKEIGIPYYDPDAMIKISKGRCIHDNYYFIEGPDSGSIDVPDYPDPIADQLEFFKNKENGTTRQ